MASTAQTDTGKKWNRIGAKIMVVSGAILLAVNALTLNGLGVVLGIAVLAVDAVKLMK